MEWIVPLGVAALIFIMFGAGYIAATYTTEQRYTHLREALNCRDKKQAETKVDQDRREAVLEHYEAQLNDWAAELHNRQRSSATLDEHATSGPARWVIPNWAESYHGHMSDPGMPVSPLAHHRFDGRVPGKVTAAAPVPLVPDLPPGGRHTPKSVDARNAHAATEAVRQGVADDPTGTVLGAPIPAGGAR